MKIAWFTPFSTNSAIGRASRLIVEALASSAEVHVWHPESECIYRTTVPAVSCSPAKPIDPEALAGYDVAVYNFGNCLPFQRDIIEVSRRVPGIVVLHDFVLHHLFAGYYLEYRNDPQGYIQIMERWYGEKGAEVTRAGFAGRRGWVWETDEVAEFPLFEEATRGAYAVVAHSDFLCERVRRVFDGPVRKLALAYDCGAGGAVRSREELGVPEDKVLLLTVGHVNPNKRVLATIEALARHPELASRVVYVVVGPQDPGYQEQLASAVKRYGLQKTVRFEGYASDDQLRSYLTHADVCINLRFPATEGASASAIEELLYGKPLVVTDTGFYRELPGDCVRFIRPEREAEDLSRALHELVSKGSLRESMGARARQFAQDTFRADLYAAGIVELAEEVMHAKPMFDFTDRIGTILSEMGVGKEMPLVSEVARRLEWMFRAPVGRS